MKTIFRFLLLSVVAASLCIDLPAQESKSNSVGFQLNPYLHETLFKGESMTIMFALRYNFAIKEHITLGPELSGNILMPLKSNLYYPANGALFNVGGYIRYSFLPDYRIRPFAEFSPYIMINVPVNKPENAIPPIKTELWLSGYLAPGVSLFSKSDKYSLDLFYKVSKDPFLMATFQSFRTG